MIYHFIYIKENKNEFKEKLSLNNKKMSQSHQIENDNIIVNTTKNNLEFPKFESIKVSTKTFIIMTNITIDIDKLFQKLPITEYILIPKKRGRKPKNVVIDPNKDIKDGSIISLIHQDNVRGVNMRKKKKTNKSKKTYFRNSITVIMIIDGKKVNYKVSRNGKIQMTGCKRDETAENCIKWFWNYIKDYKDVYKFNNEKDKNINAIFIPAMRNIDFDLNFIVDREKLDEYFNLFTEYNSLLETSFGYTGVNIKIPITKPIKSLKLKKLEYEDDKWSDINYVEYTEYLSMLSEKEVNKKLKKKRYNTFLVFHSGKVIMSGMEESFMKGDYITFTNIIKKCYNIIEEKLNKI